MSKQEDQRVDDAADAMAQLLVADSLLATPLETRQIPPSTATPLDASEAAPVLETDARSVFIGNLDFNANPPQLERVFSEVGEVVRITIRQDRFTGQPRGYAYLEFADVDLATRAVAELDGYEFLGRLLSVKPKRTNIPRHQRGRGRGRGGRGGRGRGRGGRGRGGRGRGRGGYGLRDDGGEVQATNDATPASVTIVESATSEREHGSFDGRDDGVA